MTAKNVLILLLAALAMGRTASSVIYAVKRRYEQAKREAEPIPPIPASEGKLCTSDRVGLTRGVLCGMLALFGVGTVCAILAVAQAEMVLVFVAISFFFIAFLAELIWVLLRRRYGDSIRYTDTVFTVFCLRTEPRRQTYPWSDLRGLTVLDKDHIRLDFKNGTKITLAYLTDTDGLVQTALDRISDG